MFQQGQERIALVTDTACDLLDEQLQKWDIRTVSLRIATSSGEFRDRTEISQEQLYKTLETEVPKTSLPLPEDVSLMYRKLREEGATRILHYCMSGSLSGTYNMIRSLAAETEGIRIDVVDTQTLSCGLGLLLLDAAECLDRGMSPEDVIARTHKLRTHQLGAFVIRTLEFLRKGGRIGLVEGVVGSLLKIKPVIFVNDDGVYATLVKARGFGNALNAMKDEFIRRYQGRRVRIAVVHGNAEAEACQLLEEFRKRLDITDGFVAPVSPALAIHTGPGLLGAIVQFVD